MGNVFVVLVALATALYLPATRAAGSEEADKLRSAAEVLDEIMEIPETGIPASLMANAEGVVVAPEVMKVGLVVGGRDGAGVVTVRGADTGEWGYPLFVRLIGASIGWQIGAQSSDLILVVKNRRGVMGMMDGKFTLGADAAVAAGPMGRDTAVATDPRMTAEIYSYSRSRGLFVGLSLEGTALEVDLPANAAYYGEGVTAEAILNGHLERPVPIEAEAFRERVDTHTRVESSAW